MAGLVRNNSKVDCALAMGEVGTENYFGVCVAVKRGIYQAGEAEHKHLVQSRLKEFFEAVEEDYLGRENYYCSQDHRLLGALASTQKLWTILEGEGEVSTSPQLSPCSDPPNFCLLTSLAKRTTGPTIPTPIIVVQLIQ